MADILRARTVTFNSNGGSPVPSQRVWARELLIRPDNPAKAGFDFSHWSQYQYGGREWDFNVSPPIDDKNFILYAQWEIAVVRHTVTFNSGGGSAVANQTVAEGGKATEPADPTKAGVYLSKFDGWYKEAALTTPWDFDTDSVTEPTTLYAKWTNYTIGDTGPGGGKIFYVETNPAGFEVEGYTGATGAFATYTAYYLEVAPSNSGTGIRWGDYENLISGVSTFTLSTNPLFDKIGNGRKDTALIVAHLAAMASPETGRAAQLASTAQGGQNDWFLPSIGELYLLYDQKSAMSDIALSGLFWSSSQYSAVGAWYWNSANGARISDAKNIDYFVRAVRAF